MAELKVPTREGFEVFPNDGGGISIKQEIMEDRADIIVIHPDDVDSLINFLHEAKADLTGESHADETGFSATASFADACILGVEVRTNGFQGGDAGHGGETHITFRDESSTAMDLIDVKEGTFTIRFRGDAELRVLARAIHYLDGKLKTFR